MVVVVTLMREVRVRVMMVVILCQIGRGSGRLFEGVMVVVVVVLMR